MASFEEISLSEGVALVRSLKNELEDCLRKRNDLLFSQKLFDLDLTEFRTLNKVRSSPKIS